MLEVAESEHTFVTASQSEWRQRPYNAKDILGQYGSNLCLCRIRTVYR